MTVRMLRRRCAGAMCTAIVLGAPPAAHGDDLERCAKVAQALMRDFCATASDYTLTASAEGGLRINIFKKNPVGGEGQVQFTEQDHRGEVKGLVSADQRANLESIRACMQPHISAVLTAVFECRGNQRPSASSSPQQGASGDPSRHGRDDEMDSERSGARPTLTLSDRQRRSVLDGRAQVWMTRAREWGSAKHHVADFHVDCPPRRTVNGGALSTGRVLHFGCAGRKYRLDIMHVDIDTPNAEVQITDLGRE